ncbi:MAG: hypothetical protein HUU16_01230 [Candidatus Omnitrophica bacterium]|nr:hypothetical protein [bacterium]NUN94769.1 hypothetical protein [Candidatus Omnitrophota bacterium]
MTDNSDPNVPWTAIIGAVGFALLIATVVGTQALYYMTEKAEFEQKVVQQTPEELTSLRAKQFENLNAYRWVNKASGTVAIPIEQAMQLVVRDAGARPAPAAPPLSAPSE